MTDPTKTNQTTPALLPSIIHELKSPLNTIIGFAHLLGKELEKLEMGRSGAIMDTNIVGLENHNSKNTVIDECNDCLNEINLATKDLNELVNDLLDVESVNSGNFSVDLSQEIDVADMIKRAIRINWDYALARRIKIKLEVGGLETNYSPKKLSSVKMSQILFKLDTKRMKQIMTNLILNSLKYSSENTEIKISVQISSKNILEIIIQDQGFGMTKDQLQNIFTKYQTFQNPNSGKVDSLGLGLSIVKQLIEAQNGKIEVASEVGVGTVMMISFG